MVSHLPAKEASLNGCGGSSPFPAATKEVIMERNGDEKLKLLAEKRIADICNWVFWPALYLRDKKLGR